MSGRRQSVQEKALMQLNQFGTTERCVLAVQLPPERRYATHK